MAKRLKNYDPLNLRYNTDIYQEETNGDFKDRVYFMPSFLPSDFSNDGVKNAGAC
jgi:hypothetical protein